MDVLWFRLPRDASDTDQTQGRFDAGRIFIMLNRGDYWQCAFVIPKGGDAKIRAAGLDAFRKSVAPLLPFYGGRTATILDWDHIKLLTVKIDRLKDWARPGLLCIGDAAHAMSPVGGVGINLAVQDAVAAANILAEPLRQNRVTFADVQKVQARREFPTRMIQAGQKLVQDRVIGRILGSAGPITAPLAVRLLDRFPLLRRIPGRMIGLGIRRERVRSPLG